MRTRILFAICVFALSACANDRGRSAEQRPNILLIMIDDLNDWIGCMHGHPQTITPNIDRLASKGILFTNAHAQTAICNPSRTSMMTSLYPGTTGIYFNAGDIEDSPVAAKSMLLTRRFEQEGYEVLGAGKLYHHNESKYMLHHAGRFGGFGPLPEEKLTSFEGVRLWDWGVYPEADSLLPDHKIAEWAVDQLQKDFSKPFFLGVGFFRPHVPLYTTKPWFDLYPASDVRLPEVNEQDLNDISEYTKNLTSLEHIEPPHEWILKNHEWKNLVRSYLACISFVDHQVGKVLHALEDSPYRDNTYIILLSDHGFHLGEKERWAKQTLWEVSTRAPLIIAGPGIAEGKSCVKPVQLLDIYPTLLELTGLAVDQNLEGHSIVPLIEDTDAAWPYIARSSFGPGNYAIRSEHYRYIHYNDGSEEFYDHRNDPLEWNNAINDPKFQKVIDEHRTFLPESSFQILGSGSTGHKAYHAAEEIKANQGSVQNQENN